MCTSLSHSRPSALQIAAHVKEKLHFAQQQCAALAAQVEAAEAAVAVARSTQRAAKATAERLQHERSTLAEDWQVVTDRRCLADMLAQQERLKALQAQAAALQARYQAGKRALQGLT